MLEQTRTAQIVIVEHVNADLYFHFKLNLTEF